MVDKTVSISKGLLKHAKAPVFSASVIKSLRAYAVIITPIISGLIFFISLKVSLPVIPGILISENKILNSSFFASSIALNPSSAVFTSYPSNSRILASDNLKESSSSTIKIFNLSVIKSSYCKGISILKVVPTFLVLVTVILP